MTVSDAEDFPSTILSRGSAHVAHPSHDAVGHYLVAIEGIEIGRRVEIGEAPVTIGRNERQTLAFATDTEVSRLHARVTLVNGEVIAEDLGSTNGTFVDGARVTSPVTLHDGSMIRVGHQVLQYERRSRRDVERAQELDRDFVKAKNYLLALLPAPVHDGTVRIDWRFVPSAELGGDGFGYYWLDPGTFVFYLIDVSGHGVGAALHAVAILNVLRQRALPGVDFRNPGDVLASLNDSFQMDGHGDMFFTIWYGVYRADEELLTYSSAGHHPAYLVPETRRVSSALGVPAMMIGAVSGLTYSVQQTKVARGSTLYLFSDGVFEILTRDRRQWGLNDFLPLMLEPAIAGASEPERLHQRVKEAAGPEPLDDDFSLVAVTFQ